MNFLNSRFLLLILSGLVILGILSWAFWPRSIMVDIGKVSIGPMSVTINEESKTRVRKDYIVSTPVDGKLLRIEVKAGDQVEAGKTILAKMIPANPSILDIRTHEQAKAFVIATEATLEYAKASVKKALADKEIADLELKRVQSLRNDNFKSQADLDHALQTSHAANAALEQAHALVALTEAALAGAQAMLMNFTDTPEKFIANNNTITILAPISGQILRVMEESEKIVPVGKPIIEIGNILTDLEIVAELLSTDAAKVAKGNQVTIKNWGGQTPLKGLVERIEPFGFTKVSPLGVEEQRVNVIIKLTDPPEIRNKLGHGFQVEAQIIIWDKENVTTAPSSALFRQNKDWTAYVIKDGKAVMTKVTVGHDNGIQAEILEGLQVDDEVVLYPGPEIKDGAKIKKRQASS
jgi:HlyD family secretion protein